MRRGASIVIACSATLAIVCSATLAACTFLVPFNDPGHDAGPTSTDDGGAIDASAPSTDDGSIAVSDATSVTDSGPDLSTICKKPDGGAAVGDGWYCANHDTSFYPGPPNILFHCVGGAVAKVETCAQDCVFLTAAYPDECDDCAGKTNGNYCGRDFETWDAAKDTTTSNLLVGCRNGQKQADLACVNGCQSGAAGTSACK